jgi:asparagine synthase (glutamine-hydrolysing)
VRTRGPAALERVWGMFAFVVAGVDGSFVVARDPLGITPLYWIRDGDTVVFASELKGFDPERRADVEVFPPGHYWTPDGGLEEFHSVGAQAEPPGVVRQAADQPEPPDEVLAAIRDTLVDAVEGSMIADVPVGAFLSGGLDSSLVTAIAARAARRDGWTLPTFSIGLADSEDLAAARQVAAAVGTDHHERVYTTDDLLDWTPEVVGVIESFDTQLVNS